MSAFNLLKEKRFGPFFWVQFWGAFNDNVFKNALVILIAYRAAVESEAGLWINIASGLFILPFFLFSPLAGQIADKFEKSKLVKIIKFAEIIIMTLGAIGFWIGNKEFLILILFLMGAQSAFFGPVKYSILPQSLRHNELVAGNALIELGTFLAILTGTILGGLAVAANPLYVAGIVIFIALLGYVASLRVPLAPATASDHTISFHFSDEIKRLWNIVRQERSIHLSILAISWFWFYGATFLSQLPNFTKYFIRGDETVGTLFLAIFSVSIGFGSMLCERLSRERIELGLVGFGAFGMTIFAGDLFFIPYKSDGELMTFWQFLSAAGFHEWRVMFDLWMLGMFGSFFIVPLYALIQKRSPPNVRSRVIAWLNIVNSLFIVMSAIVAIVLYALGLNTIEIFLVVAILNHLVAMYVFLVIPEFLLRFGFWILGTFIYKIKIEGDAKAIPSEGAIVIVANHVSFIDWLIITAATQRPPRFVMDHRYFFIPVIKWFFHFAKAIPIAPAKESEELKKKAFDAISKEIKDNQLVCLFPEGAITRDGKMAPFRPGVEQILKTDPCPVVPVAMVGLWGSFFSRKSGKAMSTVPTPSRREIRVIIGSPMRPESTAKELENAVRNLAAPYQEI